MNIQQGVEIMQRHLSQDIQEKALELLSKPDSVKRIINPLISCDIKTKFNNYYTSSNSICYGDALEEILNLFLQDKGVELLPRTTVPGKDCDCLFQFNNMVVLIEVKVRDDHDSSKKNGQINNMNAKLEYLRTIYPNVIGVMWFIDPAFEKNKCYYEQEIGADNVIYGDGIEIFLSTILQDNRCAGLFQYMVDVTKTYNTTYTAEYVDSLNIDYHILSSMQLRNLVRNKYLYKEAITFFLGDISVAQLLEYARSLPRYQTAKEVIEMLEEYDNEL